MYIQFEPENLKRPPERLKMNVRIILKICITLLVDWTHLAQNKDRCWALVNMVMNLQVL
jgi:hypothetical protein